MKKTGGRSGVWEGGFLRLRSKTRGSDGSACLALSDGHEAKRKQHLVGGKKKSQG